MISEAEGCAILTRVFESRGYRIARDVLLAVGGVELTADGWDADARVGFEYMTLEAGDHADLTPAEMVELGERMERGELFLFVIDENRIEVAEDLEWAARAFLDEVARRRGGGERG
ncbi:MAG: hypothetical protein R3A79_18115 [Nannocystaceae bacterium]